MMASHFDSGFHTWGEAVPRLLPFPPLFIYAFFIPSMPFSIQLGSEERCTSARPGKAMRLLDAFQNIGLHFV